MKIRTDFVTNSSSSSFVVEISLQSVDGKEYSVMIDPDDGGGNGSADLKCSATDVAKIDSVEALVDLLTKSADIGYPEECEEEFAEAMNRFGNKVRRGISDVSQIASIKFKKTWAAGGEGSSCFGTNLENMAEELPGLAKRVCESKGEEKEVAKKEMAEYLAKFSGSINGNWGGRFPSGFMGSTVTGAIVWDKFVDSIEKLAKKVLANKLPEEDWAEETTEINMQTREISQKAEYILDGMNFRSRERRRVRRKT